jgi:starvation-inducible DNA-binding protein
MPAVLTRSKTGENPVGLPKKTVEKLLPELDAHVASLFVSLHQLQKHHWLVEGPQFRDLHLYLNEAYSEAHQAADKIAERMTVLGGVPTAGPTAQAKLAYLTHEEEGQPPVREMLAADLGHATETAKKLRETARLARDAGDLGTEHLLMELLLEVEERAHHLDHYLQDDSLEDGRGRD